MAVPVVSQAGFADCVVEVIVTSPPLRISQEVGCGGPEQRQGQHFASLSGVVCACFSLSGVGAFISWSRRGLKW